MKFATVVYLAQILENLSWFAFFVGIGFSIYGICYSMDQEKFQRKPFIIGACIIFIALIMPSRSTILTAYVASDERVENIASDTLDLIEKRLKELKEEK